MRMRLRICALALTCIGLTAPSGLAQQTSNAPDVSLGDIARQLKREKAKAPKPVLIITNDNIETSKAARPGSGVSSAEKKPVESASKTAESAQVHDEMYFRSRLGSLQDQLETHKRELAVLQQKLGQNAMQYYADPNKSLMQEYSRSDIDKLTAEIDAKKQQIADDEKAILDLHDQLRREGGDPAWLR